MNELSENNLIEKTSDDIFKIITDNLNESDSNYEQDENLIIEKSPSLEFHKRNKKYFQNIDFIDSSSLAIEPNTGRQVIWNEIYLKEKHFEKNILLIISRLRQFNHPFLLKFYEVWTTENTFGERKLVFITERITIPTLREFITHTKVLQRLNDKGSWKRMTGQLLSALKFLQDIGVINGHLTNENIYQSNNIIKLGLGSFNLLPAKNQSYSFIGFGKLILEMCAYQHQDNNGNLQPNNIDSMLQRIIFDEQRDFISNTLNETNISVLFENFHLKLKTTVISLKVLAGQKVVDNTICLENNLIIHRHQTMYSPYEGLLRAHTDYFDNDTVIMKCRKKSSDIILKWENFLITFAVLPKFLEDIRNGFYSIFTSQFNDNRLLKDYTTSNDLHMILTIDQESNKTNSINMQNSCCLKVEKLIDLDSISVENEEYIKELEVKDKIYVSHITIDKESDNESYQYANLINLSFNSNDNGENNLIDFHSAIVENKLVTVPPDNINRNSEIITHSWEKYFDEEIEKLNSNDISIKIQTPVEILPHYR